MAIISGDVAHSDGNLNDGDFANVRENMQALFEGRVSNQPVFTTDADGLWETYLSQFPEPDRQYHTCHACRRFIETYGSLAVIDEKGAVSSAIWDLSNEFAGLNQAVRRAKVTGVFLSRDRVWGLPVTGKWTHFAITPPKHLLYNGTVLTPSQAMAEKREDHKNVLRALAEFSPQILDEALRVLNADALYRSEKVIGPAQWLRDLHAAAEKANRSNVVWRAVATAPPGFAHPRSSMIGTLLEDIEAGMDFEAVSRRFKAKMHPLQYQRPQAAPSAASIAQAEKVIASLGAAGSLSRRFARVEEIDALWRPSQLPESKPPEGSVFGHLKPKGTIAAPSLSVPAQTVTWEKFVRVALPVAAEIEVMVPSHGNFVALLTAENADAPPILQWDSPEKRNPFSLYVYHGGSAAHQWGLTGGKWASVTAVCLNPSQWFGGDYSHHSKGAIFVVEGAKDSRDNSGNALFPETLKSELHSIRWTIESYSRSAKIGGREEASACGITFKDAQVRVTDASGGKITYKIDRLD